MTKISKAAFQMTATLSLLTASLLAAPAQAVDMTFDRGGESLLEGDETPSTTQTGTTQSFDEDSNYSSANPSGNRTLDQVNAIVNLGARAWRFIERNQPVTEVQTTESANAIPMASTRWDSLQNWREGWSPLQTVTYRNLWNREIARFAYRLHYSYNGDHNGNGRYLQNVRIVPQNVHTAWGWKVSVSAEILDVSNAGSTANPMAQIGIVVNWHAESRLNHVRGSHTHYVTGDGQIRSVN